MRLFDWKPFLIFICLLPAVGLLLVFLTYPLGLGIWLAFTDTTIGRSGQWIGVENFQYLFEDTSFWQAVFYSVFYTAVATVGKVRARASGSRCCSTTISRSRAVLRAIILLPWITPTVLSAIAFWWIYDPQFSIISYVLVDVLGVRDQLLRFSRHGVAGALVADRRQHLARHSVRRHLAAGRPADHLALALRGGAARRLHGLAALPLHHLPDAAADPCDRHDLLDHLHLHRFPARLCHHARRAGELHASDGDAGVPARHPRRQLGEGAAIAVSMIPFLVFATLFSYFALARRKWQQGESND